MQHVSSRNVARTPEKGVFPLDHFNECKHLATDYLGCLNKADFDAAPCREISKHYLQCRMERSLMAKQELAELGFFGEDEKGQQIVIPAQSQPSPEGTTPQQQTHTAETPQHQQPTSIQALPTPQR